MSNKRALVLGASGMVGAPLCERLIDESWEVYGASRFSDGAKRETLKGKGVKTLDYDIHTGDPSTLPDVDVLFLEIWDSQTWGSAKKDYVWNNNYHAVGRVVERYAGIADVINGCTINVYGDGPHVPDENCFCRPTSEYGAARLAMEKLIDYFSKRGGKKAAHLRYAHSNRADRGRVYSMAESILEETSLGPNPDAKVQVISLEDFVDKTYRCVDHLDTPGAIFNICHPRIWTMRELAEKVQTRLGRGAVIFDREKGGEENSAVADARKMVETFGEPVLSVDSIIDRVADYLLKQ